MRLGDILSRCLYGTTGYVADLDDVERLAEVVELSLPVLRQFSGLVVATNYADAQDVALTSANRDLWRSYFPDCVLLDSPVNRGHSIGTADLDNLLFHHAKATAARWLCKSSNDVTLDGQVLKIPVTPADFYFINAVSYDAICQHNFDLSAFEGDGFFFPQSTFWVMDTSRADKLIDPKFLDASFRLVGRIPDYNGRIWEHLPGWSCEYLLRQAVLRNGLTRCSLLDADQWHTVLELTVARHLTDCSLKGISVNGICHVQGLDDPARPLSVVD